MKYTILSVDENGQTRQVPNTFRYFMVLIILVSASFCVFDFNSGDNNDQHKQTILRSSKYKYSINLTFDSNTIDFDPSFTINTEGCTIPFLDPFDETVKGYLEKPTDVDCPNVTLSLLDNNNTHIWVIHKNMALYDLENKNDFSCCYKYFYRSDDVNSVWSTGIDDRIRFSDDCNNFTDAIEAKHEFVKVSCYLKDKELYKKMFIFAIKKDMMKFDGINEISQEKSAYNVLILGIDNVSRMNFHRTMPGTLSYLKNSGAVELLGYNKVGLNSYPNIIPMLTGKSDIELPNTCYPHNHATFDFCPFVWNSFKRAGFYTALGEDTAHLGTFNYLADGFIRTPTDYYMHPFIYMAEREVATKDYLCLKEKYLFQVLLDYVAAVANTLNNKRLFGFFWEVTMSHDYLNYPMVMDETYVNFFKELEHSKYLEQSIIFLVSDHGTRWGSIRDTKQGRLEEMLPFVFMLTPKSFQSKYKNAFQNLKSNSQRLTTPFDIHETLSDLVNLENIEDNYIKNRSLDKYSKNRGISLFLPVPLNRSCDTAAVGDKWCTCHKPILMNVSANGNVSKEAGEALVHHLNILLENYTQCSKLVLKEVVNITELIAGFPASGESGWQEYLVSVITDPGKSEFEGVVRKDSTKWKLIGTANRLNRIGIQDCILHPLLRLYCQCQSM